MRPKNLLPLLLIFVLLFSLKAQAQAEMPDALIYKVKISGVIDMGLASYVKRALAEAAAAKAQAFVLEINTPGGRVDAAVAICDALLATPLQTISFINGQAISAGALIAMSTSQVGMTEVATIGDIEPQPTSEKAVSYIRGRLKAAAEKFGRPADILAAMADKDQEIPGLNPKGKLITLTTREALTHKVVEYQAASLEDLLTQLDYQRPQVKEITINWAEILVRGLTHPLVSPLLLTFGFMGILIEIKAPGFGLPGILGITCFFLFFAGHLLVGLAGLEALILFLIGIVLLALEVFVIPGFGVTGIAGIACLLGSLFLVFSGLGHIPAPLINYQRAANALSVTIILTAVLLYLLAKQLPKTHLWQKLVLREKSPTPPSQVELAPATHLTLGATGAAITPLRPVGKMEINGQVYEAMTNGEFLPAGTPLSVIEITGNRVVVKKNG